MSWEENVLLSHRIIFLSEEINTHTANRIISQLLLLEANDQKEPIDLYINSPGGSVSDGLAIVDTIQCIRAPVSTICIGLAASMGAWILAAGKKGRRFATPNAEIMIHQLFSGFKGHPEDLQVYTNRIVRHQQSLVNMLSEWTGQPEKKIQTDIQRDYFMNAAEALRYGIIDEILEPISS